MGLSLWIGVYFAIIDSVWLVAHKLKMTT